MDFPTGQTLNGDSLTSDETLTCDAVVIGSKSSGHTRPALGRQ